MDQLRGNLAVITGAGDGMGRELALALSAVGCHVALCDVNMDSLAVTAERCVDGAPENTRVSTHRCDVSVEAEMISFRDAVVAQHGVDRVELVFNNAGIGGGGSVVVDPRESWERTFGVCWYGVYYGTRTFLPLLMNAEQGYLINFSSVNGMWASIGMQRPHTAYSAAKFAVRGFTEALINDLAMHAPNVSVSVVMPGHIGTGIVANSIAVHGTDAAPEAIEGANMFRNLAPTTASQAAGIILEGVLAKKWRILVGDDAHTLDAQLRAEPERAYEESFIKDLHAQGAFNALVASTEPVT